MDSKTERSSGDDRLEDQLEDRLGFQPGDPENPRNWAMSKKVYNSLMPIFFSFAVNFTSTIYVGALLDVQVEYNISTNLAISGFTFFALGVALGPVLAAPLSELYGRRPIYLISPPLGLLLALGGALAPNFAAVAGSRFGTGLLLSPVMAVGAGTLQDVWDARRDTAGAVMAVALVALIFVGAELGPVAGSFVTQDRGWRWAFWLPMVLVGAVWLLALPMSESKKSIILRRRAARLGVPPPPRVQEGTESFAGVLSVVLFRSLNMLFTEPIVLLTALHGSYALALFYVYYIAIPYVMLIDYGFTLKNIGLSFLPMVLGSILAIPVFIVIEKTLYQKATLRSPDKKAPPEARLYGAMIASVLLPISLFWFAWTSRVGVHWAVPVFSGVVFGLAQVLLTLSLNIYIFDVYEEQTGASAVAGSSILRYVLGAVFPLFTVQLLENLGVGWGMSLFGFISVLLLPTPWLLHKWGGWLRSKSKYVPV